MEHKTFTLKDGRELGYGLWGPQEGRPVLYFHGTPSSCLEPQLLYAYNIDVEGLLHEANIRLISVDRPGIGLSTYNKSGSFLSFAYDVKQLTVSLGIESCPVLCWSGGGPYALAIAHQNAELISGVYILCGFSRPFDKDVLSMMGSNKWYFRLARYSPLLLKTGMEVLSRKEIKSMVPQSVAGLAYVDYALLKQPEHINAVTNATMKQACFQGAKGPVREARGYYRPFGFQLSAIKQPVHYWWGSLDMAVIRLHAEAVEKEVRNAVMHYRENEGHLSLYIKGFVEALQIIGAENASLPEENGVTRVV